MNSACVKHTNRKMGKKVTEKTLTLCSSVTKKNIYMVGNEMMKSNRTFLFFLNCVYSSIMIRLRLFFYPCERNNGAAERGRREGRRGGKKKQRIRIANSAHQYSFNPFFSIPFFPCRFAQMSTRSSNIQRQRSKAVKVGEMKKNQKAKRREKRLEKQSSD